MTRDTNESVKNTSLYYSFFQNTFELADATSCFWQPMLKAIGRAQLEMAGLQVRQTQAFVHWAHQLARPVTPMDFFNANAQLWTAMMQGYLETAPRVTAAVETAVEVMSPKVLEMPPKQPRDTLILLDRDVEMPIERKVA